MKQIPISDKGRPLGSCCNEFKPMLWDVCRECNLFLVTQFLFIKDSITLHLPICANVTYVPVSNILCGGRVIKTVHYSCMILLLIKLNNILTLKSGRSRLFL